VSVGQLQGARSCFRLTQIDKTIRVFPRKFRASGG
jgi:hypothetical protein